MVWYRVGSRNETMGATGITHLVEHLLFGNVGAFRKGEIGALVARNGGQFNAFTSDDFTTFFEVLPPAKLDLALRIESERMRGATFAQSDVQAEIGRLQEEFEDAEKDIVDTLAREVRAAAFHQHPYHNPTTGWRSDVDNLTAQQARAYYTQYFRSDNATLVIVGDVKAQAVLALVKKYFEPLPKGDTPVPAIEIAEQAQKGERRVVVKYSGKQEALQVAYHAPAWQDADAPAMFVLEKVLAASYSGRLKTKLVNTKLCSSAQAAFEAKKDPGLLTITCYAGPGVGQDELLEGLDAAIGQLRAQPVPDSELKRARNQAEFSYSSEGDGPYRAGFHLGFADSLVEWQRAVTWPERLRSVSAADVQRVAKRYLNPDARVIGWLSTPYAPKPPAPKPPASDSAPPKEQPKPPHSRQAMGARMTGFKQDDSSPGPNARRLSLKESKSSSKSSSGSAGASTGASKVSASISRTDPTGPGAAQTGAQGGQPLLPANLKLENLVNGMSEPRYKAIHQHVLKNGLTLVVLETHLSPIVQVTGAIKAGDAFDSAGKRGLAAVVTQCLNYGSTKHNRAQFTQLQEDIGLPPPAMLKFDAGTDSISFQTRCLSRDLASQLANLAENLTGVSLADADIDRAKQDSVAAIKRTDNTLSARVERAMLKSLISANSPYAPGDSAELAKSIANLKPPDVKAFHQEQIVPGAATIVLAGDITIGQATQTLEKAFATWTGRSSHARPLVQPNSRRVTRMTIPTKDGAEGMVCLGQLLRTQRHQQEFAQLQLADCVLISHPMLARLSQAWTSEPALQDKIGAEGVQSRLQSIGDVSIWSLTLTSPPDVVHQAVQTLVTETKKFTKAGITQEELSEAKRFLAGMTAVRGMSNLSLAAKSILDSTLQTGEPDFMPRLLGGISDASVDSVNRVIRSNLKPDEATMVIAAGPQTIKTIRDQVLSPRSKPGTSGGVRK